MPKVICTHRHAGNLINGIKFERHKKGKISEEISAELAVNFLSIPGYIAEDSVVTALIDNKETPKPAGQFLESSFADRQAAMPASLLTASPGFDPKEPAKEADTSGADESATKDEVAEEAAQDNTDKAESKTKATGKGAGKK
jgi:hypothetical protein